MLLAVVLFAATLQLAVLNPCYERVTEFGKVCVCNASYCDTVPEIGRIAPFTFRIYTTSEQNPGFSVATGNLSLIRNPNAALIKVTSKKLQTIEGFGGAFTDSATMLISSLSEATRYNLLDSYYGNDGIEYSIGRVPIGGTDFSPMPYSYDDVDGDVNLDYFALHEEDINFKIPIIQEAVYRRYGKSFQLFASCWTAPPWMKTNHTWTGYSFLRQDMYQVFANYLRRFFEEYANYGVNFWAMTTGNEPSNGFTTDTHSKIPTMGWIAQEQAIWISQNLGPTLRYSNFSYIKIIIHDDNRITFPYMATGLIGDQAAKEYISGVGVHWYLDSDIHPNVLDLIDYKAENLFMMMTEACIFREDPGVKLGDWERGARYMTSILEYLDHRAAGWIDWNIALTMSGGPTYIGYPSDSPIIVDLEKDEFYKQPMFYAMGHMSKFVLNGSYKLKTKTKLDDSITPVAAFERPDDIRAVVILNKGSCDLDIQIEDGGVLTETIKVAANSINTVLYSS